MAIVYDKLMALKIPDAEHSYGVKDTMLYALGVGLGHDPTDRQQLDFVYEKNLKALPTFACLLGYPGFWVRDLDTGIDWVRIVNGEQGFTLKAPVKPRGTVIGRTRILDVIELTADACKRLRGPNPKLCVLGLNPHAGEHGRASWRESAWRNAPPSAVSRRPRAPVPLCSPPPSATSGRPSAPAAGHDATQAGAQANGSTRASQATADAEIQTPRLIRK